MNKFHDVPLDPRHLHSPSHMLKHTWNETITEQRKIVEKIEHNCKEYEAKRRSLETIIENEQSELIASLRKTIDDLHDLIQLISYRHRELTRRSLLHNVPSYQFSSMKEKDAPKTSTLSVSSVVRSAPSITPTNTKHSSENHKKRAKFWSCFTGKG